MKPAIPPEQPLNQKRLVGYSVVINDLPKKITLESVEAAARKEGEVLHVKLDKKKSQAVWIEFKDKISARRLARKGLRVDDVRCTAVRVRPISAVPAGRDGAGPERPGRAGPSRTLMVRGLLLTRGAAGLENRLRRLFAESGNVTAVRVNAARELAFVDFATVTGMRRARKGAWALAGAPLQVTCCRRALADAAPGGREVKAAARPHGPPPAKCRTILVKNLPYSVRPPRVR
jgi:hypothetical protein